MTFITYHLYIFAVTCTFPPESSLRTVTTHIHDSIKVLAYNMPFARRKHQTVLISVCDTMSQENCAIIHSFITFIIVGRLSQFFQCCIILQEICNKTNATVPIVPHIFHCTATSVRLSVRHIPVFCPDE